MAFIVALGVIIVLLCSASVLRLLQPNTLTEKTRKRGITSQPTKKTVETTSKPAKKLSPAPVLAKEEKAVKVNKVPAHLPEMITLNLAADPDHPYTGYELLQTLLTCGMRFGTMSLFHRHEKKTGIGPVWFSLAACTENGTFDLTKIGGFSCNGLVLFMKPKTVEAPLRVFELMLHTADQLINELGGKVLNEQQQLLKKSDVVALYKRLQPTECVTEGVNN